MTPKISWRILTIWISLSAPAILEDIYNFEDSLLIGLMLITLLKHADRVKIACLAQLVNVIAPIITEQGGGRAWKQTIFYPFMHAFRYGRGVVLHPLLDSPVHDTKTHDKVTDVDGVAVWNEQEEELTVFAVNRNIRKDVQLLTDIRSMEDYKLTEHIVMQYEDMKLCNNPSKQAIAPRTENSRSTLENGRITSLPGKGSWNVIRMKKQ